MNRLAIFLLITAICLAFEPGALSQDKGVINDPDGFTNVRAASRADAAVVAKVKVGEVFEFEPVEDSEWWEVKLASGKSGWMHRSRIRFHSTLDEIPAKDQAGAEITEYAKERGFDYCSTARTAGRGDTAAMKRYFAITDTDGGAAESHASYFNTVIHLLGDDRLAAFLLAESLDLRLGVRNQMNDFVFYPFESFSYLERNFPKTFGVLHRKEVMDWESPDGRFIIRKVFSGARATEDSKVTRAELLDKVSGKVLADLTSADIGRGAEREGRVLWSDDSKRFAFFSGAQRGGAQTIVFESKGGSFHRAGNPIFKLPGREEDAEIRNAKRLWIFEEPIRWTSPDMLALLHHEYFEGTRPDGSINAMGRTYDITRNFATGDVEVKVHEH